MTQKYIQKAAGWGWAKRYWARLHEPRYISAFYGFVWAMVLPVGIYSMFNPPRSIEAAAGDSLMTGIAALLTVSGLWGFITVATGRFWAERYAVGLFIIGGAMYWGMVVYLAFTAPSGNRWMQVLFIFLGIGLVALRSHWIFQREYSPRVVKS